MLFSPRRRILTLVSITVIVASMSIGRASAGTGTLATHRVVVHPGACGAVTVGQEVVKPPPPPATPTNTSAPRPKHTATPTDTPVPTDTPGPAVSDTFTPTPTPTDTPTEIPAPIPTDTDTPTLIPENTPTDTLTPVDTETPTVTDTPTDSPTPTETFVFPTTPTDTPTAEGTPTNTRTAPKTPTPVGGAVVSGAGLGRPFNQSLRPYAPKAYQIGRPKVVCVWTAQSGFGKPWILFRAKTPIYLFAAWQIFSRSDLTKAHLSVRWSIFRGYQRDLSLLPLKRNMVIQKKAPVPTALRPGIFRLAVAPQVSFTRVGWYSIAARVRLFAPDCPRSGCSGQVRQTRFYVKK